jgi:hypothetical protein
MSNYTLIDAYGKSKQVPFIIKNGKEYVSDHISRAEFAERGGGELVIFEPLIELFESVRETAKKPIVIYSGYRSPEYQKKLYQQDIAENGGAPSGKVAKPGSSPHQYGAAMDLAIPVNMNAQSFATLIRKRSLDLKFPMARTGWKQYGGGFVHADLVHMLFEPNIKGKINPNPVSWKPGVVW